MPKNEWTQEMPTKEGWYFWRRNKVTRYPFHWLIYYFEEEGLVWDGRGIQIAPPNGGWWSGPIQEPKG